MPCLCRRIRWIACFAVVLLTGAARADESSKVLPKTGLAPKDLAAFDEMMVSYVRRRNIPGAALAVVKDGRLVLARGYGWADRQRREPVQPNSKFRIASLSKSITAVAVLQLVERNHLSMDTCIFDLLELERHIADGQKVDSRLKQVTVGQLLRHTGGFDRGRSMDPMFHPTLIARRLGTRAPAESRDVIRYMTTRPLDFPPGSRRGYSNFGYCLLGRAIERVSGLSYASYVRRHVLTPLGMRDTQQGRTLAESRAEGEVTYYAGDRPYGSFYLEAMDANGAWISSAVDMARFVAEFDQPKYCRVLSAASIKTMFARPKDAAGYLPDGRPRSVYYANGWMVRKRPGVETVQFHGGGLDGAAAIMVRRPGRLNWVALFNTRYGPSGEQVADAVAPHVDRVSDAVKQWPDVDLFDSKELR